MSSLRYAIVIPAGGGKTTLSQREGSVFLDVDALYHLREAQSTYDRMNAEIGRRAAVRQPVSASVAADLRRRIASYRGPARCLLLHSLTLAQVSDLRLLAVLVPSPELHKASTACRSDTGKWFAGQNIQCLEQKCRQRSTDVLHYSSWTELQRAVDDLLSHLPAPGQQQRLSRPKINADIVTPEQQDRDEQILIAFCTLAVGCEFQDTEPYPTK